MGKLIVSSDKLVKLCNFKRGSLIRLSVITMQEVIYPVGTSYFHYFDICFDIYDIFIYDIWYISIICFRENLEN